MYTKGECGLTIRIFSFVILVYFVFSLSTFLPRSRFDFSVAAARSMDNRMNVKLKLELNPFHWICSNR